MSASRGKEPAGRRVDESGTAPSPKAYTPPLVPASDDVRVRVRLDRNRLTVDGQARVGRGVHAAFDYAVVCLVALVAAVVAFGLCYLAHAGEGTRLAVAAGAFLLVFVIGLIRTPASHRGADGQ